MLDDLDKKDRWSSRALRWIIYSIVATAILGIADGVLSGPVLRTALIEREGLIEMLSVWVRDFRYLFEQLIYAAAIIFIGAKFIEMRTILTVGFDKLDRASMSLNGPDDNNTVWIGRRYGSRYEADLVADAFKSRLSEDAT